MNNKEKFEALVDKISESWGLYLHGKKWESGKLHKPTDLTREEHEVAMRVLADAYYEILNLCSLMEQERSPFKSKVYRVAICMSEEMQAYGNAYNLAFSARETPHRAKFFRDAVKRNRNKQNVSKGVKIDVDLNNMVREI